MSLDLSSLCVEQLRECGARVADCPAYVARYEADTRSAVAEYWSAADMADYYTAHVLAMMWHESRLNRCAVGPDGRMVLDMTRNPHSYTESEVRDMMAKVPRNAKIDLGPGQILWRYARSCGGERATVDDLIGSGAARTVVCNLHSRSAGREPWGYWPGLKFSIRYAKKIGRLAARLMRG